MKKLTILSVIFFCCSLAFAKNNTNSLMRSGQDQSEKQFGQVNDNYNRVHTLETTILISRASLNFFITTLIPSIRQQRFAISYQQSARLRCAFTICLGKK